MSDRSISNSRPWLRLLAVLAAGLLILAACGDDDDDDTTSEDTAAETEGTADTDAAEAPTENACPPAGCEIAIVSAEAEGDELAVVFEANYLPDLSNNHIHIYWDTYDPEQVSGDAVDRGVEQGLWHPTDEYPDYTTQSDVSVSTRGDSETLCVTAANGDHNVLDPAIEQCLSVADQL